MIYEVKSAIILAAGRGSRLNELTSSTPKPLIKVKGQILIERMIEQLQQRGIECIYIVTGYKHWMFNYLEQKYGVILIYNKKWFCTNNIISFIKAYEGRSRCSNLYGTIMLDADLYINDINTIKTKIDYSGYYLEYSDDKNLCSKEWTANIHNINHKINNIITEGVRNNGYILRSLSYWTPQDMLKLYTFAKEIVQAKNVQCYIDNIPCILYANKFYLKGYISDKNAISEIDSMNDYIQINKE